MILTMANRYIALSLSDSACSSGWQSDSLLGLYLKGDYMHVLTSLGMRVVSLCALFTLVCTACTAAPQFDKVYKTIAPASLQAGQSIPAPKAPVLLTVTGKIG